jgi:hypothetical protein
MAVGLSDGRLSFGWRIGGLLRVADVGDVEDGGVTRFAPGVNMQRLTVA